MKIFKYPVQMKDRFTLLMPDGAQPISVQMQHGEPQVWAIVNTDAPLTPRQFYLRGTGHDMGDAIGSRFIGTFQVDGSLVFHLFDGGEA